MADYDVIVVGAGPGGYVSAIRCAQLGLKTACIDKWQDAEGQPSLGGTCLNVGCIPSKALLDSTHTFYHIQKQAAEHGIHYQDLDIDIATMQARKQKVVKTLTQGIAGLFKKNKVEHLAGLGRLVGVHEVEVIPQEGQVKIYSADHIIIATGSMPTELPNIAFDHEYIVDSTGALAFEQLPKHLGIIGAGVIGLELGSVWSRLGSQVTVLEALPDFLPAVDRKIATAAQKEFKKQGLNIQLQTQVTAATVENQTVRIEYQSAQGEAQQLNVDKLVVAVGRKPYTEELNLEALGIKIDDRGFIQVNGHRQTAIPHIYAIGDVIGGPMLAHKASDEGIMVAERIGGQKSQMHYETVPWVIYTHPEIAWVGRNEAQLKEAGIAYKVGQFPFMAIGRARAQGDSAGMVRILADATTDRILGVHILGASASELIAEAVVTMEFEGSSEDLARSIHAHPTLSEAIHEAALAVDERAIHI
ncbi:MAG: dihydrolipoyl dehydrogenase [Pseudomonadota bacterium]|nr:dihydrolipoyl dehydrogenase [Pseudomonadota bacterium]